MRRKTLLTTLALALTLVAGSVCAPLTARAAEPDTAVEAASETESNDDTSGQDEGGSGDSGSSDTGSSDNSGDSGNSGGSSGSEDDRGEIGDILDGIFGGNKPEYNPDKPDDPSLNTMAKCSSCGITYAIALGHSCSSGGSTTTPTQPETKPETPTNPGNSGNTSNNGNAGNNGGGTITGSVTDDGKVTVGGEEVPGIEINDKGEVTVGGVVAGTKDQLDMILNNLAGTQSAPQIQTLPARLVTAIPVADPATLALFPNSMFVQSPAGLFFHSVDTATGQYNLWNAGTIAAAFNITDAKGNVVTMTAPTIAYAADGSAYINVTIPAATKGAVLAATPEQKAAWLTYGIAGVMANGVTLEQFTAVPAAALVPAAPAA